MASMLYFNGVDSVSISKRLGHAQVSTTANIYAHVMEEADQKNADILADVFLKKAWIFGASWTKVELFERAQKWIAQKSYKKRPFLIEMAAFRGTAEGIRTPDLLVRSKRRNFLQLAISFFFISNISQKPLILCDIWN